MNLATPFLVLNHYHSFQKYQMCLVGQLSVMNTILNPAAPLLALNSYYQSIIEALEINLPFYKYQGFFYC